MLHSIRKISIEKKDFPIFNMGFFVMLILRMLYKKLTTYRYSIDIVQAMP